MSTELKFKQEFIELSTELRDVILSNDRKIPESFVNEYADKCTFVYGKTGDAARTCVMTTTTGNKIVGHALILDPSNDVEEIGNKYAKEKCTKELWSFLGGIATSIDY